MAILTSFKKTITILSILLVGSVNADSIGEIIEEKGYAGLTRDGDNTILLASDKPDVLMYDTAQTQNGRMKIKFEGEEELALTEHSKVWIDEVYYDPAPSLSIMSLILPQSQFEAPTSPKVLTKWDAHLSYFCQTDGVRLQELL